MLRHSRAMTRHHRERIIKKKAQMCRDIYYRSWVPDPIGKLAKYSTHHHACSMCTQKYLREKWRYDESSFI